MSRRGEIGSERAQVVLELWCMLKPRQGRREGTRCRSDLIPPTKLTTGWDGLGPQIEFGCGHSKMSPDLNSRGWTRSTSPPILSHVFPLRVLPVRYMYRPIMYRPTCIVRRYMYRTTYTRGLGSHKPKVRVVGRQEDVRGRRIHVLPCVLPCGLRIHVEYGADSCFYPIHIMFLPNTQLNTS